MNNKVYILRFYRGFKFILTYLFFELPRGLDLSLRNKSRGITLPGSHGYALTQYAALKNIMSGICLEDKLFLDIGSGKGGVIIYSNQLGSTFSAGIEYEKFLHDIAVKNISQLKLNDVCKSFNMDAREFKNYADYDILFLFNPFDDLIYEEVIREISLQFSQSDISNERYLICYGGANIQAVNRANFSLIREDVCPFRCNLFRVFKLNESV